MDERHSVPASNRTSEGSRFGAEIGKPKIIREMLTQALSLGELQDVKFQTVSDPHATVDLNPHNSGARSNLGLVDAADTQAIWDPHLGGVFADPECLKLSLESLEEYSI